MKYVKIVQVIADLILTLNKIESSTWIGILILAALFVTYKVSMVLLT